MKTAAPLTFITGSVTSRDGTIIGYRQIGNGPGVILLHGGLMTSQNFETLATALADTYTVYVPDRRGRGLSGPHGNDYCLARECEDVQALLNKTNTHYLFGLSSGAIIALQCAYTLPAIHKAALYEPPLPVNGARPDAWTARYEQELAQGKLAEAFVTIIKETSDTWSIGMLPRFILDPLMNLAIRSEPKDGDADIKALIPTMRFDARLVAETGGGIEKFRNIQIEMLLLGGNRSMKALKVALNALSATLPHSRCVEFPGIGHLAADNSGKPKLVAQELKRFFGNT